MSCETKFLDLALILKKDAFMQWKTCLASKDSGRAHVGGFHVPHLCAENACMLYTGSRLLRRWFIVRPLQRVHSGTEPTFEWVLWRPQLLEVIQNLLLINQGSRGYADKGWPPGRDIQWMVGACGWLQGLQALVAVLLPTSENLTDFSNALHLGDSKARQASSTGRLPCGPSWTKVCGGIVWLVLKSKTMKVQWMMNVRSSWEGIASFQKL